MTAYSMPRSQEEGQKYCLPHMLLWQWKNDVGLLVKAGHWQPLIAHTAVAVVLTLFYLTWAESCNRRYHIHNHTHSHKHTHWHIDGSICWMVMVSSGGFFLSRVRQKICLFSQGKVKVAGRRVWSLLEFSQSVRGMLMNFQHTLLTHGWKWQYSV